MREESESWIRKWEEMWFKTRAEDGERRGSCDVDVRWKTVRQTSGCNRKRSVADSGQTSDEYVERPETLMRQNVVVVWLQCLLVDVLYLLLPFAANTDYTQRNIIATVLKGLEPTFHCQAARLQVYCIEPRGWEKNVMTGCCKTIRSLAQYTLLRCSLHTGVTPNDTQRLSAVSSVGRYDQSRVCSAFCETMVQLKVAVMQICSRHRHANLLFAQSINELNTVLVKVSK